MPTERIQYVTELDDKFSRKFNKIGKDVRRTDSRMQKLQRSASGLQSKLGGLAAAAGFAEIGRQVIQVQKKFEKLRRQTQQITGAISNNLSNQTSQIQAIAQTFNKDYMEVLNSANTLTQQFDITMNQALSKMEKGFLAGGDATGEMLEQIKEFSPQFKDAKSSADGLMATIIRGANEGIFSDKAPDAVKEFGLRIREQTKPAQEALEQAFGKSFTEDLFGRINSGATTTVEALDEVITKLNKTNPPAKQTQQIVADLFGGPGEDVGLEFLKTLEGVNENLDSMVDKESDLNKAQKRRLELNKELSKQQEQFSAETRKFGNAFEEIWLKIQSNFFAGIRKINKGLQVVSGNIRDVVGTEIQTEVQQKALEKLNKFRKEGSAGGKELTEKESATLAAQRSRIQEDIRKLGQRERELKSKKGKEPGAFFGALNRLDQATGLGFLNPFDTGQEQTATGDALTDVRSRRKGLKSALKKIEKAQDQVFGGGSGGSGGGSGGEGEDDGGDGGSPTVERSVVARRPTSINIDIENLIERFNVTTQDLDESTPEIREKIIQAVLQGLNNAQTTEL